MTEHAEPADWTGRRFEVTAGPVAHGGHCVARVSGRVVFVRHALPSERVLAEVTEDHGGSYCRADAVRVLAAAPDRVDPPCPVARPGGCGGCDWQHASAAAQRELKAVVVAEQLRRLAGLEWPVRVEPLPGGVLGWRTRVRLVVDGHGRPGFRAHRSHRVVPVPGGCPITVPGALDGVLAGTWRPGAELEVVRDAAGEVHVTELPPARDRRARPRRVAGSDVVTERAAGREWRLATHGFWQVHPAAADTLAAVVGEWAAAPGGGVAWDLYGGVGLFAAVLADQVGADGSVLVVEASRRAVADGAANLADLPQVRFATGPVDRVLARPDLAGERPDVVVLDPPRKGAGRAVVGAIAGRAPARVVYVACDPAALARDVALFAGHGYALTAVRAFDAFPMTHHVESVALLAPSPDVN
ncbi:class I SAM-dependent RNA methyltransferase [Gandjariella thermophila]|uniref:23S rRNA methyltransferase n=1 Tax=Gandjariella thermophila TaxID=1931992 RepID=A0A4D4JBI0_9PSEU|nr:class I SAM-dependent RNA methyltransferase [Gandjariella thermophila]GDY32934.1 23S rRNA methyltransferase [Gandjariella thermophila]